MHTGDAPEPDFLEQLAEDSQILPIEDINDILNPNPSQDFLRHWINLISPFFQPGDLSDKPVKLILALGVVSIPLMMSGSVWVAPILATGASIVAICSCWM